MRSLGIVLSLAIAPPVLIVACGGGNKTATWPQPVDAGADGATTTTDGDPDNIEAGIARLAARVAPDMQPEGAFVRQAIAQGQHQRVDITLKGDECYTIIGLGGAGVGDLDMTMLYKDPTSGQLAPIAQDGQNDQSAILGVAPTPICPPKSSDIALDLSAKTGAGQVGVRLYSKPNPQVHPPITTTAGDPTEELMKKTAATMAKGMSPEGQPLKQTMKEGEMINFTATLTAGKCYAILAVSPPNAVADFEMKMMMPPFFTVEVEHDKRTDNIGAIGYPSPQCPITIFPVPYRVDITAKKGSGPVMVQLFSKTK
jgi:hypothetical protein